MAWALLLSCSSTRSIIRTPPPLSLPPPNPSNRLRRSLDPSVSESAEVELRCVVGRGGGGGGGGGLSRGRVACRAKRGADAEAESSSSSSAAAAALWAAEAAYVVWLFLLPYAPGDPVWAIKQSTISDLLGLSLNFFFILPLMNSSKIRLMSHDYFLNLNNHTFYPLITGTNLVGAFYGSVVGIHVIEAPVLHPMAEGLFNFVIGWTFLFAPLLFTDRRRDRYKGSLDLLWGCQMFLTNDCLHYID